jgi:hypothetical protein
MKERSAINPWFKVFTNPRSVAKKYCLSKSNYGLTSISGIYGFLILLQCLQNFSVGTHYNIWIITLFSLVFAIPVGYVTLSISAWLLFWTGKLLGGEGEFSTIRSALTWSKIPEIVGILGWILLMVVYGSNVFIPAFIQKTYNFNYFNLPTGVMVFQIVFSFWSFVVLLQLLAEVQGFSAWLALINVILKAIVLAVFATVIFWFLTSVTYVGSVGIQHLQEVLKL